MKHLKKTLLFAGVIVLISLPYVLAYIVTTGESMEQKMQDDTKAHKDAISQIEKTDSLLIAAIERAKKRNAELDSLLTAYNKKTEQISK